eukprot:CAMPEP_0174297466 /NCGR_PEP_ID=MMETSP0809-20121228/51069_1 /TAXON_ID=73025 ORGANISM="Eutreptiella gymnastica-like, Strain CCMP1594" /NCGR_SAMPLE_ID=MMETSP0809 /ASSEMBLY_ACC=CAM_ASM_000658 /LENGTH=113 /DNA_ID=CAMNT_0015401263 /DNA_START=269 /DNA_END=610 /DNA_ORIENTATION=+
MMHITTQSICLAVLWQRVVGSCNVPVQKADTSQDDVCSDQRIGLALFVRNKAFWYRLDDAFVQIRDVGYRTRPVGTPVGGRHLIRGPARPCGVPQADHGMANEIKLREVFGLP